MFGSLRLRTSFLAILLVLICSPLLSHAEVGFRRSLRDSTDSNFLTQRPVHGMSRFQPRPLFEFASPEAVLVTAIDSAYSTVTLAVRVRDTDILPPTILSYEQYRDLRWKADVASAWRDEVFKTYKRASQQRSGEGIAIDVPFRIKSKTFRRLFGGDNVGVRVQGNITINGNVRRQKTDQMQAANQQNANTSFRIDMVQQFTITGKIGEKVEVRVDQNSERVADFENSIRLAYTGDEDEIVQSLEAGNINLNLGTRLATFSGKNTGLFGLKSQMKLGALNVTGIASLERGQKNRQRPNQQAQGEFFDERDFMRGVYFWLTDIGATNDTSGNSITVPNYRENYRSYFNRLHRAMPEDLKVQEIEVYVSQLGQGNPNGGNFEGRAVAMQKLQYLLASDSVFADSIRDDNRNYKQSTWQKLNVSTQYTIDQDLGVLRLLQPLQDQQALAVAFLTRGGQTYGKLRQPDTQLRLILLRPPDPTATDSTWNLMFRNVYFVGGTNIIPGNFSLTLSRAAGSANGQEETSPPAAGVCPEEYNLTGQCTYLTFFRLDVEGQAGAQTPDGVVDAAVFNPQLGELQFFDLTPFNPSGYTQVINGQSQQITWRLDELERDTTRGKFRAPYLYTEKPTQFAQHGAIWKFATEFKGTSSVFQLGPLVLEGSEEVTLNGQALQRGIDYTVDYGSGELRILNEAAKAAGANLEITYESGQFFQLDKKTLMGARAEYELWDQSYIGGMVLHLNEKTLDKRVRIGSEPIRNTLYDANTRLRFTPNFLSRLVDALPLVRTDQGSEVVLDGEVARVYPNPNSLENPATGDYNGLAYLDDFEQSRRATPLGLLRRTWTISSIPDTTRVDHRRGRFRWWNPRPNRQVPVQEVFPDREVNSQVANTLPTLILNFTPQPGDTGNPGPAERSWGGVMRYLGEGYADQSQAQYLELWVDVPSSSEGGKLVVDLGEISEDALPNNRMDSEDRPVGIANPNPQQEYGNGLLDRSPDEDTGLDGAFGADPTDVADWNGDDHPVPSGDDWSYNPDDNDPPQVNGTENSRNDEAGNYPDTEDLNNDNFLNTSNNYFSYSIALDFANPYIAGGNPANNWRLFRIPIQTPDTSVLRVQGAPDLTNIRWARLYMTGANRETKVRIVQMDIVSNEWLPTGGLSADSADWLTAAVINTHENPGYQSPPGVEGQIDPVSRLRQREQSLVLKVNRLDNAPGGAPEEFFLVKNLHQAYNLLEYKRLKMFVHGGSEDEAQFADEKYDLILRFASNDVVNNYYDIVVPVKRGWNPANVIDVALNDITLMNARRDSALADTVTYPGLTAAARFAYDRQDTPSPGDSLVIKGSPSFSRIYFVGLGVRLLPKWFSGEGDQIWVDELRVSDIYKDPGTAAEVNASIRLADFITLQGGYSTRDADFHNVNVRTSAQGGAQSSSTTVRGNATVALQKLGLDRYGFQLPLSVSYTDNLGVPKYIPNTDSRVDMSHVPEEIKSVQQTYGYTMRYSKGASSKNRLVRWSLEKLTLGWDYNYNKQHDFNTRLARSETGSATAGYSFPTAKGRGVAPLAWTKGIPGLRLLGSPKFYYKPTRLQVTARADRRDEYRQSRGGVETAPLPVINTGSGLNVGFNFINPLTTDFTRSYRSIKQNGEWLDVLQGDFGRINDIQQNFNNTFSPQLASWLRPTLNYTGAYSWSNPNLVQAGQQSVSNQRNVGADLQLDFRAIFGGGGGRGRDRGRGGREQGQPPRPPGASGRPGMENPMAPPGPFEDPLHELPQPGDSLRPRGHQPPRVLPGGSSLGVPDSLRAPGDTTATPPDTTQPVAKRRGFTLGRQLGQVLSPLKKALLIFDPIALSYDNNQAHAQRATSGQASWQYQLGFSQTPPGTALDSLGRPLGNPTFTRRKDQNLTGRSGIRFTQDIRSTFNYGRRWGESIQGTSPSGNTEETMLWIIGKKKPVRFPIVDVTMDWSGLEKIAFLSRVAQTVSLTSGISQKVTETWQIQRSNVTQREHVRQWNPLLGVNLTWKGNIDSQVRYGVTNRFTDNPSGQTQRRSTENRVAATVSYTIRTGFRIPIMWLKSVRLQNQTTFSLNVDYSSTKQEQKRSDSDVFTIQPGSEMAWSLSPRMTYSFSNTVQGQGYVQLQQRKDAVTSSKSRVFEFGIQVNIAIRG